MSTNCNSLIPRGFDSTGADEIFVAASLVNETDYLPGEIKVALTDGTVRTARQAMIDLVSPYVRGRIEVIVFEKPMHDVLIGNLVRFASGEVEVIPTVFPVWKVEAVKTRAQAKKENIVPPSIQEEKISGLTVLPTKLIEMQEADSTLARSRDSVGQEIANRWKNGKVRYEKHHGILHRVFEGQNGTFRQICVPVGLRQSVMRLAHDTPLAVYQTKRQVN